MSQDTAIVASTLSRQFGEIVAVDQLTLEIQTGEIFGFLGHNGAGKTTTVRLLNGILDPTAGSAQVLGLDPRTNGPALRRRTGVLTETPSLDERLTGRENLEIYADLYSVPQARVHSQVAQLLERAELGDRADEKVGDYSKGMKQRLALARALVHRPELLFLDEPTSGLDPVATRRVHELITRLSHEEQRTIFLCTHNLAEAQKLCDRVAVLEHGRLVALGTPAELARQVGGSQRLEIEIAPESLVAALDTLRDQFPQAQPAHEDATIYLVGVERGAIPDLVAALVGAGVRVFRVAAQEPSLEDVYFALHDIQVGDGQQESLS
jgi:ABC-2 type transport system ATP-binding protein